MDVSSKPYSVIRIAINYIRYYLTSDTRHDVHSPLVYGFIDHVLKPAYPIHLPMAELKRKELRASEQYISFIDYGKQGVITQESIATMAKNSLKSKKYARVLAGAVRYYQAKQTLELGTSLGITSAYLASASSSSLVTMEGDPQVAAIAKQLWEQLGLHNIKCIIGNFDNTLTELGDTQFDIIYVDGNHHYAPTIRYFEQLQHNAKVDTLFIFDDIHYSPAMEQAWQQIKSSDKCGVSIDLFFLGFVFCRPVLQKQHFVLRF
ncbi:MAG: class I SAM-dependent methyltransferase [Bacteroidetes bacterium]|nr:class I SAM-dependent methyltransferase [Bacteroidota bacterium]